MAAENAHNQEAGAPEDKVSVGSFTFTISAGANARITEQIGDILEAQVILRGSKTLGFGTVSFSVAGENGASAGEGDIQGTARLDRPSRGKGKSTRGRARKTGGRARRSADDPSALDEPTSEANAEKGATSVKAVTDGLNAAEGGAKRGGKARGGAAAKPRQRRERGEPSKTLVYMRNLPYSYDESKIRELISSKTPVTVSAVSLPTHKFGQHKGSRRGFGFVTVNSEEDQSKLIEALEGLELSPEKPSDAPAATEGGEAKEERKFKLVARKGYENEEKDADEKDASAGASGEQQSGEVVAAPGGATPAIGGHI